MKEKANSGREIIYKNTCTFSVLDIFTLRREVWTLK
jgi:hypothetical protein